MNLLITRLLVLVLCCRCSAPLLGMQAAVKIEVPENDLSKVELFAAVTRGDNETAARYITSSTVAWVDDDGNTLLHVSAEQGHERLVSLCLEKGAGPNVSNTIGRRPQDSCCTPLHMAARNGKDACVVRLLKAGADVEALDQFLHTPLHNAAWKNHLGCLSILIDAGAAINAKDIRGGTPLLWAALDGFLEVINKLLEKKADPTLADKRGHLPIHHAAYRGFTECVRVLMIANKETITALDRQGHTPVSRALWAGKLDCLNLLVEHQSDLDEAAINEMRMLCTAVQEKDLATIRAWFDRGFDQERMEVVLQVKDRALVKMGPGVMPISLALQKRVQLQGRDSLEPISIDALSERACKVIDEHRRSLYILSGLYGILGERGPAVLNGWCNMLKRTICLDLHKKDDDLLIEEVCTAAQLLGIPALASIMDLLKDTDSSRC